ncbi:MAG: arsenate reductase family protein [Bacillota bacterium]|jgi:arsenate reductase|nr:arsenate reductase family protein [Bacillota bacterium]HHT90923.1 arsenate reductase family protein [Bacillota bacterium]
MPYTFLCYPRCSTCRKAQDFLDEHGISYTYRDIKEQNPSAEELAQWIARGGHPLKKYFNTSGQKYRALGLKDRLPTLDPEEQIELLASDGMLIKRPLLIGDDRVFVGFKPDEWRKLLG